MRTHSNSHQAAFSRVVFISLTKGLDILFTVSGCYNVHQKKKNKKGKERTKQKKENKERKMTSETRNPPQSWSHSVDVTLEFTIGTTHTEQQQQY